jgi:hypothetical protein
MLALAGAKPSEDPDCAVADAVENDMTSVRDGKAAQATARTRSSYTRKRRDLRERAVDTVFDQLCGGGVFIRDER